jgi:transposase InsO family protein
MSQREIYLGSEQKFQQRVFIVRIAMNQGTQAASIRSGISARTIRSWKARFLEDGIEGLKDRSRVPKRSPNRKDVFHVMREALFEICTKDPGLTTIEILAKLLLLDCPDIPTVAWIKRTKRKLGLTKKIKRKKEEHKKRYEIPEPGFLQIDTKYVEKADDPGQWLYQFTAIDECTRVRFLGGSLTKGAEAAKKFLIQAVQYYESLGIKVKRVQTDHGTEFTLPHSKATYVSYVLGKTPDSLFTKQCQEFGIRHRLIKPRTPQLNGKVERSHKTDNDRFYSRFTFDNEFALDHALKNIWMPEYNEKRPHGSLGGIPPMEFLQKKLKEIALTKAKKLNDDQKIAA